MPPRDQRVKSASRTGIGIIDIGSNSIRLVVYDGEARTPLVLFNEKSVCALVQGLETTGRLNPDGIPAAIAALGRFVRLARAMNVSTLEVVATAAVREAEDGRDFVTRVERDYGIKISIISGEEEARLSALGVLCGMPDADGLVADLGGGSLELVTVDRGKIRPSVATMPLGVLRLFDAADGDIGKAAKIIDKHYSRIDWMGEAKGKSLYAVGGAWRSIARILIDQTSHPLHVLDNFTLERAEALRLLSLISKQSPKSLEKISGLSRKRVPYLPFASLVLEKLLVFAQPARLVFSVWGMREGRFFRLLPAELQKLDPLIAACSELANDSGRFPEHGAELLEWMTPMFPKETDAQKRLRYAACLLGDLFWNEHPDFRAEQAFLRVMRMAGISLGHRDRASLALAVYVRYQGEGESKLVEPAERMLSDEERVRARLIGLLLRLGHAMSGGVPGILTSTKLRLAKDTLILEAPGADPAFTPELLDRRLDRLARAAGADRFEIRWT